jgi:glycosyltransferase involved in cell wall biosynthesis
VRPEPRASEGPLVTVIIATYNRSEVLRFALRSALDQTYRNLEVLVIGDACTDDSGEVVASFDDPRVSWINLEHNSGSQAGPNQVGLELARGQFVAYLGHDDLWHPDHIALLIARRQASGAELVSGVCEHVWPGRLGARRFGRLAPGGFVPPSTLMHDTEAGRRAGGWRDHRETVMAPDNDFIARLVESGARHSRVNALSVVKFASGLRPGSYRTHESDEQERWSRRIGRRSFVARELLSGMLLIPFRRRSPHLQFDAETLETPGAVVAELRRIRGLD